MDSPWEEQSTNDIHHSENQWDKLSSDFTNAGYREGITAGKEGALQEGFDSGFALTGVPLGRDLGRLRGISSAILALTTTKDTVLKCAPATAEEAREIASLLGEIRFSDIVPADEEAELHEREHRLLNKEKEEGYLVESEELEDMLWGMSAGGNAAVKARRPTSKDREAVRSRLELVVGQLDLHVVLAAFGSCLNIVPGE